MAALSNTLISDVCVKMNEFIESLETLLMNSGSVPNFFHNIFTFLANRTDFYQVSTDPDDPAGLPPGMAENLVLNTFYKCNPYIQYSEEVDYPEMVRERFWSKSKAFLPAGIAHEVEITTSPSDDVESFTVHLNNTENKLNEEIIDEELTEIAEEATETIVEDAADVTRDLQFESLDINCSEPKLNTETNTETEQIISDEIFDSKLKFKASDSFNGAVRDLYAWSQSIADLDIKIKIPKAVKSSKHLKVNITAEKMLIEYLNENRWTELINEKLSHRIRPAETVWLISEGFIGIHLEKQGERWWNSLTETEAKIDTNTLNCSRPLHDLPEEQIEKIRELQWNQMQKLAGKPTSDQIAQSEILKRAWNQEGSPFAGEPFDPSILS